jgi:hypothetical protein
MCIASIGQLYRELPISDFISYLRGYSAWAAKTSPCVLLQPLRQAPTTTQPHKCHCIVIQMLNGARTCHIASIASLRPFISTSRSPPPHKRLSRRPFSGASSPHAVPIARTQRLPLNRQKIHVGARRPGPRQETSEQINVVSLRRLWYFGCRTLQPVPTT